MSNKHPNCECRNTKYDYFRKRYRNGTLHLMRKCAACGKVAQNAMRIADYDANWIETLQIVDKGVRSDPVQNAKPVQTEKPMRRENPVQSRADQIHEKLQRHIQNRTL